QGPAEGLGQYAAWCRAGQAVDQGQSWRVATAWRLLVNSLAAEVTANRFTFFEGQSRIRFVDGPYRPRALSAWGSSLASPVPAPWQGSHWSRLGTQLLALRPKVLSKPWPSHADRRHLTAGLSRTFS